MDAAPHAKLRCSRREVWVAVGPEPGEGQPGQVSRGQLSPGLKGSGEPGSHGEAPSDAAWLRAGSG